MATEINLLHLTVSNYISSIDHLRFIVVIVVSSGAAGGRRHPVQTRKEKVVAHFKKYRKSNPYNPNSLFSINSTVMVRKILIFRTP